ncbi:MAG: sigma-70 family RNA polymerase sigma factor [Verrucomicrobiota bacterium]
MADSTPIDQGERFTRLYASHQRRIHGLVYVLTQDRGVAEDLQQEVAARLWRKFDTFEEGTDFAAWAFAIARFVVMEWRRSSQRVPLPLEEEELHALTDTYADYSQPLSSIHVYLDECLTKATDAQRRLLNEHFVHGFKILEIAARWQRDRRSIHRLLKKTKDQLLQCIEEARAKGAQEGRAV